MKLKFFSLMILSCTLVIIVTGALFFSDRSDPEEAKSRHIIALNEIEQLAKKGDTELIPEKTRMLAESMRREIPGENHSVNGPVLGILAVVLIASVFIYLYFSVIKPFDKLKDFAARISSGSLDIPLYRDRSNYFGAFTWAFDSMRKEINTARRCEKEAVENNKTVIATLSHDIKTPIASIRAYAEGLEANMDVTAEKRKKYLSVIMSKCDEVSKLTDDLFLHSVSDLDKLEINPENIELSEFLEKAIGDMCADTDDVRYKRPDLKAVIKADKNRMLQLVENLINNSRKYAKSDIDISLLISEKNAEIHFRDHGLGIPDKDMPFIFGKFYRGSNCGREQGSGLGLYIVDYIVKRSGGTVLLHNHPDGLETVVCLPLIKHDTL